MTFEDLLRNKLGPMRDLVRLSRRAPVPERDPHALYYRRAVGLEVRARPEETWAEVEVGVSGDGPQVRVRMPVEEASCVLGLVEWTSATELEKSGRARIRDLERWVEDDLAYFATWDPKVSLTGRTGVLEDSSTSLRIARRASMWPTAAVQTAVEVAPMPFMPCGRDLEGAELVGVRFASLERGTEVLGVTITGSKDKTGAVLRALLPLLDGRRTAREIVDDFPERDRSLARKMLSLLDRTTVLEGVDGPPEPASLLAAPAADQVTWLGHAGVLLQLAGKNILVDPLFFSMSEPDERWSSGPRFDARALPPIDAVLITHGDNDHLNPNSLAQLSPDTPIYLPAAGTSPPPYQVDMRGMLRVLGFTNLFEIAVGTRVRIGEVLVRAWPFVGEDWGLDLAQLTYSLESPSSAIYLSADASTMDETYHALASEGRRFDLALMGVSGCAESLGMPKGYGYGNFYREWIPRARRNEWVQHCAGPAESFHAVSILKPRFVFGYAAGGASFIRTQYSDTGDHAQLAQLIEEAVALGTVDTRPVALPLGLPVRIDALDALAPRG